MRGLSHGILSKMLVECRNGAASFWGTRGVYEHSMARAEESGAMWLDEAQLSSNDFPLTRVHNSCEIRLATTSAEQL